MNNFSLLCLPSDLNNVGFESVHRFPFNSGSLIFSSLSIYVHVYNLCDHHIYHTFFQAACLVKYKEILYIVWRELYYSTTQTTGTHSHTII